MKNHQRLINGTILIMVSNREKFSKAKIMHISSRNLIRYAVRKNCVAIFFQQPSLRQKKTFKKISSVIKK